MNQHDHFRSSNQLAISSRGNLGKFEEVDVVHAEYVITASCWKQMGMGKTASDGISVRAQDRRAEEQEIKKTAMKKVNIAATKDS